MVSGTGLISVTAGRDVIQNASISSLAGLGDFGITAGRDIALGRIDATALVLLAGRDILDNNGGGVVNVTADTLLMIADTDSDGTGRIGSDDLLNVAQSNANAIDTDVTTLSAQSAEGIYVLELDTVSQDGLTIDDTGTIMVDRVNFNSTTSTTLHRLSDLRTTVNGPIKLVLAPTHLLAVDLMIEEGSGNPADAVGGIVAGGTGDVLLDSVSGDVVINAAVLSGSGHVTVSAADDIDLNANLTTGGTGTVYLQAGNATNDAVGPEVDGINVDGMITTVDGDVLLSSVRGCTIDGGHRQHQWRHRHRGDRQYPAGGQRGYCHGR